MVVVTRIVSLVLALALSTGVSGEELLVEFTGTGNGLTEEFEVAGPWLLDWSITSEYESEAGIERTNAMSGSVRVMNRFMLGSMVGWFDEWC